MHLYNFKQPETIGYRTWLHFQVICVLQLCYLFIHLVCVYIFIYIEYILHIHITVLCNTQKETIRNNIAKDCLTKNGLDHSTNSKQFVQALCWSNPETLLNQSTLGFCKIKREEEKTCSPRYSKERNLVWEGSPWKDAKGRGKKRKQSKVKSMRNSSCCSWGFMSSLPVSKSKGKQRQGPARVRSKTKDWFFNTWFR